MTWIFLTLFAAFMQAWRNAFQSRLSGDVTTAGVTSHAFSGQARLLACI